MCHKLSLPWSDLFSFSGSSLWFAIVSCVFFDNLWKQTKYIGTLVPPLRFKFLQYHRIYLFVYFLFYIAFNSQGHIVMGSLHVEEPVHASWSRFSTLNHQGINK